VRRVGSVNVAREVRERRQIFASVVQGDHDKESTKTSNANDGRKKYRIDSGYANAAEYEPA